MPFFFTHLTLIIQQHILWFEISVDDPLLVKMLQALDDLSSIVAGPWFIKSWIVLIHIVDVVPIDTEVNNPEKDILNTSFPISETNVFPKL